MSVRSRILAGLAPFAAVAGPAVGHPDITLYCRLLFDFDGPEVHTIGQSWTFDELFSQDLLTDFDHDGDGAFSAAENAEIEQAIMAALAEVDYLTHSRVDGRDLERLEPFAFQASVRNGVVGFAFGMRLPAPVDPARATLQVQIKDPDFLIGVLMAEPDPVSLRGADGHRCSASIAGNEADAYFGGTVIPDEITVTCEP